MRDTTAAVTGYDARSYDIAGGMQIQTSDNTYFGLGMSMERSLSETNGGVGSQEGEGFSIGAIVKKEYDAVQWTGTFSTGIALFDATRVVQTAPSTFVTAFSDYEVGFFSYETDVSKTYEYNNLYLRPIFGGNMTYSWSSGFAETGAGASNVIADSSSDISLNVRLGAEIGGEIQDYVMDCTKDCPVLRPYARISGVKYLTDEETSFDARFEGALSSNSFRVTSPAYQDFIDLNTGFEVITSDNGVLRFDYGARMAKDSVQHSILAKISIPLN